MAFEWSDVGLGKGQLPEQGGRMLLGKNEADLTTPTLSTLRPDEERALGLQSRGMQGEYGALLRAQMAGRGPSVAGMQLAQGREAAIRGATAAAASTRGANTALAGRSAAQSAGRVGMQAARDASLIRAQEQLAAQQQFGALANAQRGQDIQSRQISAAEQQAQLNAQVSALQTRAQVGEGEAQRGQLFGGAAMLGLGSIFPSDPDLKTGMQPLGPSYHYSPPETKMNMQPLGSQPAYAPPAAASGDAYGAYSPQQYGALTQAASMTGTQAQPMTPGSPVSTPGLDSTALAAQNAQSAGWVAQAQQQAQAKQGSAGGGLMSMGLGMLGSDPALKENFQRLGMSPEQAHAEALKYSPPPPNTDRAPSSFGNVGAAAPYAPNAAPAQQPAYTPTQYNAIQATRSGQENIPLPPGAGPSTDPYQIDRDIMGGSRAPGASRPMTREGTTSSAASQAGQEGGFGAALQAFGSTLGGGKFDALMKAKKPEEKKPEPPLPAPDVSQTPAAQPAYSPKGYAEDVKRSQGQLADNPYPYQKYGQPPPNPYEGEGEPEFVPDRKTKSSAAKGEPAKGPVAPAAQPAASGQPANAPSTARFPDLVQAAAAAQAVGFQYKPDAAQAQGVTTDPRVGISAERTPGSLADNPIYAPNVQHTPDGTAVVNVPMQTATLTAVTSAMARKQLAQEQELAALKKAAGANLSTTQNAVFGDTSLDTRDEPRNPGGQPPSVPEADRRAGLSFKEKQEARAQDEKMRSKGDQVTGPVRDDLRMLRPDNFSPQQRAQIDTAKAEVLDERVGQAAADIGAGVNTQRAYKQLYDALQIQAELEAAKQGKPGSPVKGVLVTPNTIKQELKRRGINPKRVPRPDEVSL